MIVTIIVLSVLVAGLLGHICKIHKRNRLLTHDLYLGAGAREELIGIDEQLDDVEYTLSRLRDVVKETREAAGNPR